MNLTPERIIKRLFRKTVVNADTGCWEWKGSCTSSGYGRAGFGYKDYSVHRLSAYLFLGLDLDDTDLRACHKCDNKICWNWSHLFVGTQKDNIQDARKKGRLISGFSR